MGVVQQPGPQDRLPLLHLGEHNLSCIHALRFQAYSRLLAAHFIDLCSTLHINLLKPKQAFVCCGHLKLAVLIS